ncbi:MAG: hypothetical protein OP8BY_1656 [Candidatus Saccharicenans subterraneus]|uniref:Uncharacterized protein n=1 Tax=Candidatus Saccharicenans subterraneus TaxID=2508984 RepID=A0A3E2BP31_9BACT|nr:MAG: hypothetical protein OP8BY_1656 [Candidatus Saccharicenans subterraneum]
MNKMDSQIITQAGWSWSRDEENFCLWWPTPGPRAVSGLA